MNQLFLPLLLMLVVAIPLVLGSRKQKRAAQEQKNLQASLSEGDRVMTTSGMYGTVADTSDDTTIDVEIAPGVVTTWLRQAVREKVAPPVDDEVEEIPDGPAPVETVDETRADAESSAQVAPPLEQHGKK